MTTRPRLRVGRHLLPGLVAVGLFVALAAILLRPSFGPAAGFPADASITANIGYAMFDLDGAPYRGEGFLVVFETIDAVLVAALAAGAMLARREVDGEIVTALLATGGDDESDADDTGAASGGDGR